jgi:hypothetical protein
VGNSEGGATTSTAGGEDLTLIVTLSKNKKARSDSGRAIVESANNRRTEVAGFPLLGLGWKKKK